MICELASETDQLQTATTQALIGRARPRTAAASTVSTIMAGHAVSLPGALPGGPTLPKPRLCLGRSPGNPKNDFMSYPSRPPLEVLPQFRGTATVHQTAAQRRRLIEFVAAEYPGGRSLRELAEQTGRTQTAVRRALDEAGVARRGRGAQPVKST